MVQVHLGESVVNHTGPQVKEPEMALPLNFWFKLQWGVC